MTTRPPGDEDGDHRRVRTLELEVRQGIHAAVVEVVGDDVRRIAVHEASRIAAAATGGEIGAGRGRR